VNRDVEYLELEDLLALVRTVGIGPVRDIGLLDAACARPRATAFGEPAYPTLAWKAAALLESLVRNHGLADGNKRLGWLAAAVFLDLNGRPARAPDDEVFALVMAVAEGRLDVAEIAATLETWAG
jgi:death-on-curing protein